jgi:hypothetical protein
MHRFFTRAGGVDLTMFRINPGDEQMGCELHEMKSAGMFKPLANDEIVSSEMCEPKNSCTAVPELSPNYEDENISSGPSGPLGKAEMPSDEKLPGHTLKAKRETIFLAGLELDRLFEVIKKFDADPNTSNLDKMYQIGSILGSMEDIRHFMAKELQILKKHLISSNDYQEFHELEMRATISVSQIEYVYPIYFAQITQSMMDNKSDA